MKILLKIFTVLFGLSQVKQPEVRRSYYQNIEREAERLAESLPNESTRTFNGKRVYPLDVSTMSKSQFINHMYNSKRIICL